MFNSECSKFKCGQIWWIQRGEVVGHVIDKTRPMIIVSSDELNASNTTLVVVPITSQKRPQMPINIEFKFDRINETALCNQITTISVDQAGEYFGSVSEETMNRIEIGICVALAMQHSKTSLKDIEDTISSIFELYLNFAEKEKCYVTADDVISDLTRKLESVKEKLIEHPTIESGQIVKQDECIRLEENKGKNECETECYAIGHKGHGFWNDDNILQFVLDSEKMSEEDLMRKWGVNNLGTLRSYKNKFKNKVR